MFHFNLAAMVMLLSNVPYTFETSCNFSMTFMTVKHISINDTFLLIFKFYCSYIKRCYQYWVRFYLNNFNFNLAAMVMLHSNVPYTFETSCNFSMTFKTVKQISINYTFLLIFKFYCSYIKRCNQYWVRLYFFI